MPTLPESISGVTVCSCYWRQENLRRAAFHLGIPSFVLADRLNYNLREYNKHVHDIEPDLSFGTFWNGTEYKRRERAEVRSERYHGTCTEVSDLTDWFTTPEPCEKYPAEISNAHEALRFIAQFFGVSIERFGSLRNFWMMNSSHRRVRQHVDFIESLTRSDQKKPFDFETWSTIDARLCELELFRRHAITWSWLVGKS